MAFVVVLAGVLALLLGPQLWARWILERHRVHQGRIPGTGGELARHLLDRFGLNQVKVEATDRGDHYDPLEKTVRLARDHLQGKSLSAIAVASHEVGHAIQDHKGYAPLRLRTRLVQAVQWAERAGALMMIVAPLLLALTRIPTAAAVPLLGGLVLLGLPVLVHLITLPVEWDASFGRALPILRAGRYVSSRDERVVRRILAACALTYVAGSLAGVLNFWRWIAWLRRGG